MITGRNLRKCGQPLYLRRQAEGVNASNTDFDDIRPSCPGFGFEFNQPKPLVQVKVPSPIAETGAVQLGRTYICRRIGHAVIAELPREVAAELLRNEVWRSLNQENAAEAAERGCRTMTNMAKVYIPEENATSVLVDHEGHSHVVAVDADGRRYAMLPVATVKLFLESGLESSLPWRRANGHLTGGALGPVDKVQPGIRISSYQMALDRMRPRHPRDIRGTLRDLGVLR